MDSDATMRPAVLELAGGTNVVNAVSAFRSRGRLDISILSGSGAVSNVTLCHPPLPPLFSSSTAASTFSPSPEPSSPPPSSVVKLAPSLAISLTGRHVNGSGPGRVGVDPDPTRDKTRRVRV
ncbi:hypothetical protein QJS04_geneDACA011953 [Acorus gramineus]|uniref:PPC domain-containing protein n=1 Tax=Acorus gramineus TaxID=55184 RepID=A0AAV9AFB8_ACOGR|nr:hypothetical protein QJS04_geneDACA011953 [Acorus gramineus]